MGPTPPVKERIVQAAVQLLRKGGARKLAQPQVAKEAGVPQGHLTYYFPKRSDLLAAVAQNYLETAAISLLELVASSEGPVDLTALLSFAGTVVRDVERTRMLVGLVVEADGEPSLGERLRENALAMRTATAAALNRDVDEPEVMLVQATLWGLALQQLVHVGGPPIDVEPLMQRLSEWAPAKVPPPYKEAPVGRTRGRSKPAKGSNR